MNLFGILALHGYSAPYAPDLNQPGTIRDARNRPIPFLIVPGVLDTSARRIFSERVAELLNEQATGEAVARRVA